MTPSQQICHHSLKPASQILQLTSNFQLHRVGRGSWLEASPLLSSASCRRLPALLLACPMPAALRGGEAISFVNSTHSPWQLLTIGPASPDWNKWPFSQYHPNPNLPAAKCLKLPNPISSQELDCSYCPQDIWSIENLIWVVCGVLPRGFYLTQETVKS